MKSLALFKYALALGFMAIAWSIEYLNLSKLQIADRSKKQQNDRRNHYVVCSGFVFFSKLINHPTNNKEEADIWYVCVSIGNDCAAYRQKLQYQ
jgi:hypothetical protein